MGIWIVAGWLVRCKIMPLTAGTWHISPGPGEQHHLAGRRRNKPTHTSVDKPWTGKQWSESTKRIRRANSREQD